MNGSDRPTAPVHFASRRGRLSPTLLPPDAVPSQPVGRLFALLDGYLVSISPAANTAAWSVENGSGTLVWMDGSYYVGELRSDMKHGTGKYHYANGDCCESADASAHKIEGMVPWSCLLANPPARLL